MDFDEEGKLRGWEGNPVLLDDTFAEDEALLDQLGPFNTRLQTTFPATVGEAAVGLRFLTPHHPPLSSPSWLRHSRTGKHGGKECNLGNLIADAIVDNFFREPVYNFSEPDLF